MQWQDDSTGGFSTANPAGLVRPVVEGDFGPKHVNVHDQRRDSDSFLNWMERVIRRRRETPEFGWGTPTVLETGHRSILAHRCDWRGVTVMAVHNFGSEKRTVRIDLDGELGRASGRERGNNEEAVGTGNKQIIR